MIGAEGNPIKKLRTGVLEDSQINLAKACGRSESEIEDLFNPEVYRASIENKFRINLLIPKFRGKKKWSERVKNVFDAHGKPWDDSILKDIKYMIAKRVSSDPQNAINDQDKMIIDSLIGSLESRLKEKEKAQQNATLDR